MIVRGLIAYIANQMKIRMIVVLTYMVFHVISALIPLSLIILLILMKFRDAPINTSEKKEKMHEKEIDEKIKIMNEVISLNKEGYDTKDDWARHNQAKKELEDEGIKLKRY